MELETMTEPWNPNDKSGHSWPLIDVRNWYRIIYIEKMTSDPIRARRKHCSFHLVIITTLRFSSFSQLRTHSCHFVPFCLQIRLLTLPPSRPQFRNVLTSPCCSGPVTHTLAKHTNVTVVSAPAWFPDNTCCCRSIQLQQSRAPVQRRSRLISDSNCNIWDEYRILQITISRLFQYENWVNYSKFRIVF